MSKKKKRRRQPKNPPLSMRDCHHLLYIRANYNSGYAKALCNAFVRPTPVVYHRELHSMLRAVPVPSERLLREAWLEYERNKDEIDRYGAARAAAWLYAHISDPEFRKAMQFQIDFFSARLGQSK